MDSKIQSDLEKATTYFYSWRLREAYAIFKRYFDRLPFKPERGHLKYIGMFARSMFELGKTRELEFYRTTLEKIYQETKSPEIGYQLAYLNFDEENVNLKVSKEILESIIHDPAISEYKNKAKMLLAYCYDVLYRDVASVKKLIDSIEGDLDPSNAHILLTWKAKVLRDEGLFEASKVMLEDFLQKVPLDADWYSHITARITLSKTYLEMGKVEEARQEIHTVRFQIKGRHVRSVEKRLSFVEKEIDHNTHVSKITVRESDRGSVVISNGRTLDLKSGRKTDLLLLKLLKEGFISKERVAETVIGEGKTNKKNSSQVYAAIHAVRTLLQKIGVSKDLLTTVDGGYRFIPSVDFIREEA